MVFPSKECLRMIASCTSFTLPLNQLVVSVKAASCSGTAVGPLSQVWVLIDDLPAGLRSSAFLMSFGVLIGKPIEVDEDSLNKVGPARMKVWCVDAERVHGSIDIFPSPNGIKLRVRVEGAAAFQPPPPPPPPSNPSDKHDKEGGGSLGGPNQSHGSNLRFTQSEWDGLADSERELFQSQAPSGVAPRDDSVIPSAAPNVPAAGADMSKFPPCSATPVSGACSNLPVRPLSPTRSGIEDLPASPAHDVVESQSLLKKKSSVHKFSAKSRNSSGSKHSMTGVCRRLDQDLGSMSRSGPHVGSPAARSPAIRSPVSTARKERRVANSGVSVLERAEKRAAAKDLPPPGTSPVPSVVASPVQLVLPSLSNDHLLNIMSDVGVVVDSSVGSPSSLLAIIRANEMAQAAIAKAKEAVASQVGASSSGPVVDAGAGSGQPQSNLSKRGTNKRAKPCVAPCRSSLRIKNLSYK